MGGMKGMKRRICLLLVIMLGLAPVQAALASEPQITDVPPGHWAYQAVKKLVSQGYLGLYPDNTFRGDQPVDRYTLAVLVSRLLTDAVSGKTTMGKDDADLLRRLTGEFRQELAALSVRTTDLEEAVKKFERDRTAMSADMAAWHADTMKVREELAAAAREIIALKERVTALEKRVDQAELDSQENSTAIEQTRQDLEERLKAEADRTAKLEKQVTWLKWATIALAAVTTVLGILVGLGGN